MTSTAVITTPGRSHQQISDPPRQLAPAAAMTVLRRNGSIAAVRPWPHRRRDHQGLPRGRGRLGRPVVAAARAGRRADRAVVGTLQPPVRRRRPRPARRPRGGAGPGRTRADARRSRRGRPRLHPLPRGAPPCPRGTARCRRRERQRRRWFHGHVGADGTASLLDTVRLRDMIAEACDGLDDTDPDDRAGRDAGQPVRRDLRTRAGSGADHGRPGPGRDRAAILAGRGPAAERHPARRGA